MGGHHDGGAEAFTEPGLFEGKADHFWQASIEQNHRSKIRRTVKRIVEFGRTPKQLTYCTPLIISNIDGEEDSLSEELGVRIRIRDGKYIVSHINHSEQTIEAYNSYLSPLLAFLREIGGVTIISHSKDLPARSLCVFLGQEIDRRRGNTELLEAVTDSLILWSLEGTDPDAHVFRTREEILERITTALPAANQFIKGTLNGRLEALASKSNSSGREIRWHRGNNNYCLPYETRKVVEQENTEDELLKAEVSAVFTSRINGVLREHNQAPLVPKAVAICHRAVELTFENQGLEVSAFIQGNTDSEFHASISDYVDRAMDELSVMGDERDLIKDASMGALRLAFYHSQEVERKYFSKLSRTYTLLFLLKNEPRIVEYFRRMSADFVLYIGTDLLIRAISEYFLPAADRMTWNMFKVLKAAGSQLILTETTLEEVISHIRAADYEFKNHYQDMEQYVDLALARHVDRILIRAYFYAQLEGPKKRLAGWRAFIGLFCTYADLHTKAGQDSLRRYLCEEFGLDFEPTSETLISIDEHEVEGVKARLLQIRGGRGREREEMLAYNDALHVMRVYSKRKELGEGVKSNQFGYRTWWLTQEMLIRRATGEIVAKKHALYMMRPEFILNFIALAPSAEAVRKSFGEIFPTLLGVRLSNRLKPEIFEKVMQRVAEASVLGEARARALVGELSDKLKGDRFKQYEIEYKGALRNGES